MLVLTRKQVDYRNRKQLGGHDMEKKYHWAKQIFFLPLVPLFLKLGITPNGLTATRIVLALPAVICQQLGGYYLSLCLLLLIIAEYSDFLDGEWARYNGDEKVSEFGKLFDPAADKVFHSALFVAFVASGWLPFWVVIIFLWRDQLGDLVRGYVAIICNKAMGALYSGKIKTASQGIIQGVIIFLYLVKAAGFDFPVYYVVLVFSLLTAGIAIYSGVDYGCYGRTMIIKKQQESVADSAPA